MSDEFVSVTVVVPSARLADFYKAFGTWLEGGVVPVVKGWRHGEPWTSADLVDAAAFYASISSTARRILSVWASRSGEWVDALTTADAVGVNGPKGVAGSLSSVGKAADRMGRVLPFEHEAGDADRPGRYRMTPLVAELFRTAATEVAR